MILGSDHSHWDWQNDDQGYCPIDWARSQAVFTFLKAFDGPNATPYYLDEIIAARTAGRLVAPYVWCHGRNWYDPRKQAEAWYSRLKDEPLIAIDFEIYLDSIPDYDDLYNVIERLRELGYVGKLIIYTGHWYWLAHGNDDSYWLQFPVWLARYSSNPPQVTPPWPKEIIWQFSASGDPVKYGITNGKKEVDENWFYGTQAELEELFGGGAVPPDDPPPGETMNYKITVNADATEEPNIRDTGGATLGNDIGNFHKGQVGYGTEILESTLYRCLKVTQGADVVGWIYDFWNGNPTYATIEEIVDVPPVDGLPVIHIHQLYSASGYPDLVIDKDWTPNA